MWVIVVHGVDAPSGALWWSGCAWLMENEGCGCASQPRRRRASRPASSRMLRLVLRLALESPQLLQQQASRSLRIRAVRAAADPLAAAAALASSSLISSPRCSLPTALNATLSHARPRRLMHSTTQRQRHSQSTTHHDHAHATAHTATRTQPAATHCSLCWRCGHALSQAATSSASAAHSAASASSAPSADSQAHSASSAASGAGVASASTASASAAAPHAARASSSSAAAPAAAPSSTPLFCPHCHTLQSEAVQRKDVNLYQIFKLLSLPQLDNSFKSLQKSLHPDRFHGEKHSTQHATASHLSSFVNSAYATLKSPYHRALYLLSLHGIELGESSETIKDPEMLMEIMETREWVEELTSPSELHAASRANRAKLLSVQQTVDAAFQARDFGAMKLATIRLSFLTNIEEEIYKRLPVA